MAYIAESGIAFTHYGVFEQVAHALNRVIVVRNTNTTEDADNGQNGCYGRPGFPHRNSLPPTPKYSHRYLLTVCPSVVQGHGVTET